MTQDNIQISEKPEKILRSDYGNCMREDLDLKNLVLIVWRYKSVTIGIFLIIISITAIYLHAATPVYSAAGKIIIKGDSHYSSDLNNLYKNSNISSGTVLSEVEVLKSRTLAAKVIKKLGMMAVPEAKPGPEKTSNFSREKEKAASGAERKFMPYRSLKMEEYEKLPEEVKDTALARAIDNFLHELSVRPVPGSYVIHLEYASHDPERAALVVNTLAKAYLESRLEQKHKELKKAGNWMLKRLKTLGEELRASRAAIEEYRNEKDIDKGPDLKSIEKHLYEISRRLADAKTALSEKNARIRHLRDTGQNYAVVYDSPLIVDLKLQEAKTSQKYAELSSRYGNKHPRIIDVKSELKDIRNKIEEETRRIIQEMETEKEIIKSRIGSLSNQIEELDRKKTQRLKALSVLSDLEIQAETDRAVFMSFMEAYRRQTGKEQIEEPQAKVLSHAIIPVQPVHPQKGLFFGLATVISVMMGISLSLLLNKLNETFRSCGELEVFTGLPCLGMVPKSENGDKAKLSNLIVDDTNSVLSEAIKFLNINIAFSTDKKSQVVAVTSTHPGEGKSTLSAWLAKSNSLSGNRTVVVDCDLHRPDIHNYFGRNHDKTLVDYLAGHYALEEVVHEDDRSGAEAIFAGQAPQSSLELLNSAKFKGLIKELKYGYDLVVIDCPACMAVADTKLIARLADLIVYAARWGKTSREAVNSGIKQLSDVGHGKIATVLTNVDLRKYAKYGYGNLTYYYPDYNR
jgi:capsular exopolysaccharide synthesis family protein